MINKLIFSTELPLHTSTLPQSIQKLRNWRHLVISRLGGWEIVRKFVKEGSDNDVLSLVHAAKELLPPHPPQKTRLLFPGELNQKVSGLESRERGMHGNEQ